MLRMVTEHRMSAIDGQDFVLEADSICIHGDTPAAVEIARSVRDALADAGIGLAPFAGRRLNG